MSTKLKISEIIIGDRVRKDLGDVDQLANSITEIGLLHPIVVYEKDKKYFLLAGHRRLEAYKKLMHEHIPVSIITLNDILKAELHENTVRKNFTFSEMAALDDEFAPKVEKEFRKREHAGIPLPKLGKGSKRTSEVMGGYFGKSHATYEKFKTIKKAIKENPEKFNDLGERIDNGMSIEYAHKMVKTTEKANTPTPDLPTGKYDLVYLDPPWEYDLKLTGAPPYKTMTLEEMKKEIKIPAHKDCVMFMWATNPKLLDAVALLEHWGFTYKTNIAWVKWKNDKLQTGTGYYVKGSHELLLIATKGSPGVPPEDVRIPSVIFAERTSKHSEKPKIFYDIIDKYYPAKLKIEMFARNTRDGWESWGNDL